MSRAQDHKKLTIVFDYAVPDNEVDEVNENIKSVFDTELIDWRDPNTVEVTLK